MATANSVGFDGNIFERMTTTETMMDKGACGEVFGPHIWRNKLVALKRVFLSSEIDFEEFNMKINKNKQIWKSLKHANLIAVYEVELRPKVLYVVMEYAGGKSLRRALATCGKEYELPLGVVSDWARQIADGLAYLHGNNIVHRDLKSGNVMLMEPFHPSNLSERKTLKITDFDEVREHMETTTMSLRGTPAWMAPEVIKTGRFSKASDIYSYGVVIWEMLTRRLPHQGLIPQTIQYRVMKDDLTLEIPQSIPEVFKQLLQRCLSENKEVRPSFDIIRSYFIDGELNLDLMYLEDWYPIVENQVTGTRANEAYHLMRSQEKEGIARRSYSGF